MYSWCVLVLVALTTAAGPVYSIDLDWNGVESPPSSTPAMSLVKEVSSQIKVEHIVKNSSNLMMNNVTEILDNGVPITTTIETMSSSTPAQSGGKRRRVKKVLLSEIHHPFDQEPSFKNQNGKVNLEKSASLSMEDGPIQTLTILKEEKPLDLIENGNDADRPGPRPQETILIPDEETFIENDSVPEVIYPQGDGEAPTSPPYFNMPVFEEEQQPEGMAAFTSEDQRPEPEYLQQQQQQQPNQGRAITINVTAEFGYGNVPSRSAIINIPENPIDTMLQLPVVAPLREQTIQVDSGYEIPIEMGGGEDESDGAVGIGGAEDGILSPAQRADENRASNKTPTFVNGGPADNSNTLLVEPVGLAPPNVMTAPEIKPSFYTPYKKYETNSTQNNGPIFLPSPSIDNAHDSGRMNDAKNKMAKKSGSLSLPLILKLLKALRKQDTTKVSNKYAINGALPTLVSNQPSNTLVQKATIDKKSSPTTLFLNSPPVAVQPPQSLFQTPPVVSEISMIQVKPPSPAYFPFDSIAATPSRSFVMAQESSRDTIPVNIEFLKHLMKMAMSKDNNGLRADKGEANLQKSTAQNIFGMSSSPVSFSLPEKWITPESTGLFGRDVIGKRGSPSFADIVKLLVNMRNKDHRNPTSYERHRFQEAKDSSTTNILPKLISLLLNYATPVDDQNTHAKLRLGNSEVTDQTYLRSKLSPEPYTFMDPASHPAYLPIQRNNAIWPNEGGLSMELPRHKTIRQRPYYFYPIPRNFHPGYYDEPISYHPRSLAYDMHPIYDQSWKVGSRPKAFSRMELMDYDMDDGPFYAENKPARRAAVRSGYEVPTRHHGFIFDDRK